MKALDWGAATSDPSLLQQFSVSRCTPCQSNIRALQKLKARHGHLEGGRVQIDGLALADGLKHPIRADEVVEVTADQTATYEVNAKGQKQQVAGAVERFRDLLYLDWYPGKGWRVVDVGRVDAA